MAVKSGNRINTQYTYRFEDGSDMTDMRLAMKMFRHGFKELGGLKVENVLVRSKEEGSVPVCEKMGGMEKVYAAPDSIEYGLAGGSSVVIRTSGSEPIINVVISVTDRENESKHGAAETEKRIHEDLESIIYIDSRMSYCCE